MPTAIHKVIVSNESALTTKYGANGFTTVILPAVRALIAADAARGLNTILCLVDQAAVMNPLGGQPVRLPTDPKQNKEAIDCVFNHYQPDYLVLLGALDIIPHQDLINPAYTPNNPNGDPDQLVPSDLPYACPGGYSRNVQGFLNPTRVVGRLADITKGSDPAMLVKVLNTAAGFAPRPASIYQQFLGVTAGVWSGSTQLSLTHAFGNATGMQVVPPQNYKWTHQQLASASHFFNCHGAPAMPQYFGQPANGQANYPVAHEASWVAGKLGAGTVAAVECCYGAELYDPALAGGQHGIANQYLLDGAYGFLGSTTIAYGPSTTNDWADVLCRDFFIALLSGASLGRALLQARQNYIAGRAHLSPVDLKTLAQFYLLGDPAVQPVASTAPEPQAFMMKGGKLVAPPGEVAGALARSARRATLVQNGLALANSVGVPSEVTEPPPEIKQLLQAHLKELGVEEAAFLSRRIDSPGPNPALASMLERKGSFRVPRASHVAIGRLGTPQGWKCPLLAGIELVQYDGNVIEKPFHSR